MPSRAGLGFPLVLRRGGDPALAIAARVLDVLADQLALLGQHLVEVLIDVMLADGFRRQVEVLNLVKPLCLVVGPLFRYVVSSGIRCRVPSCAGRRGGRDQRLERTAGRLRQLRASFSSAAVLPR